MQLLINSKGIKGRELKLVLIFALAIIIFFFFFFFCGCNHFFILLFHGVVENKSFIPYQYSVVHSLVLLVLAALVW